MSVNKSSTLKGSFKNNWAVFSFFAFIFTWLPYVFRGMWKKGLIIFGINAVLCLLLISFAEMAEVVRVVNILWLVVQVIAAFSYYNDLWRKYAQGQDFWW